MGFEWGLASTLHSWLSRLCFLPSLFVECLEGQGGAWGAGVTSRAAAQVPGATSGGRCFGDPQIRMDKCKLCLQAWEETEAEERSHPQNHTSGVGFGVKAGEEALPPASQSTTSQHDTPLAFWGSFILKPSVSCYVPLTVLGPDRCTELSSRTQG